MTRNSKERGGREKGEEGEPRGEREKGIGDGQEIQGGEKEEEKKNQEKIRERRM